MHYRNCDRLLPFIDNLAHDRPLLMCCLGDSNTNNTTFTGGAKQWPELVNTALKERFKTQKLLLVNAGVSGDTVRHVMRRLDGDALRFKPELTVLCLGTNDSKQVPDDEFYTGMNRCIDRLEQSGSLVLLRTVPPIMEKEPPPGHVWKNDVDLRTKVEATRKIAAERRLPFIDTYGIWCEDECAGRLNMPELMYDEVHTNAAGHRKIAGEIMRAFTLNKAAVE